MQSIVPMPVVASLSDHRVFASLMAWCFTHVERYEGFEIHIMLPDMGIQHTSSTCTPYFAK
jgi:hypothetical protein